MEIIKDLAIEYYKNIKQEVFDEFKDINIFIGPNNCGKSNILNAINLLSSDFKIESTNIICEICNNIRSQAPINTNVLFPFNKKDNTYLNKGKTWLQFTFSEEGIDNISPGNNLKDTKNFLKPSIPGYPHVQEFIDKLVLKFDGHQLKGEHFSYLSHPKINKSLQKNILFCPDTRLQNYKGIDFEKYITDKNFTNAQFGNWRKTIYNLIDLKIVENRGAVLERKYDEEDFTTKISEQGSGVRSLACLLADILDEDNKKIILIDEPELGLNPFAKQSFLKFLLEKATQKKQIFLTTQDPTFINPVIWGNKNVILYLYSSSKQRFVKTDIEQCRKDPDTSAGFLPHTVSLKNIHLYFEGASDVYIFQLLLRTYLKNKYHKNKHKTWIEIFNKVGLYHLCGDFWEHLLYTIPEPPYRCMVILDGDKRKKAPSLIGKHNKALLNKSKLIFCRTIKTLSERFHKRDAHPVYCLKERCIEKYLDPGFNCKKPPENYNKKVDGSNLAEQLKIIPEEINDIFNIIFKR